MKHNFGAGPCILPQEVFQEASQAVLNFNDTGLSILEISHRSKEFEAVMNETERLVRDLLSVPQGYSILFLQGGASTQFAMVPLNLLPEGGKAAYLDTGTWASKAIKEAKKLGFKLSQNTGLKGKKYAYFYCFLSEKNKTNSKQKQRKSR